MNRIFSLIVFIILTLIFFTAFGPLIMWIAGISIISTSFTRLLRPGKLSLKLPWLLALILSASALYTGRGVYLFLSFLVICYPFLRFFKGGISMTYGHPGNFNYDPPAPNGSIGESDVLEGEFREIDE
ncbi:MAG: hypothetical protein FWF59_06075 [Turicibacter sp.]|nr:hypothetical protein [Turicibacter sp.]